MNLRPLVRRLRWILVAGGVLAFPLLALVPGPIAGCYTFSDYTSAGHNFLLFSGGKVTLVFEYSTNRVQGTYRYERSLGWVWNDSVTGRQILVRPKLLWVRFEQTDEIPMLPKLPFEYRDLNFTKTRQILRSKAESADIAVRRE